LLERHEEDIEEWYNHHQADAPLIDYLCRDRVLKKKDSECLYEVVKPKEKKKKRTEDDSEETEEKEKPKNKKGEDGKEEL
jgi:hypothetical protein